MHPDIRLIKEYAVIKYGKYPKFLIDLNVF